MRNINLRQGSHAAHRSPHRAAHHTTPVTELIAGLRSAAAAAAVTVLQKVTFEANPKVRNHGEGPN